METQKDSGRDFDAIYTEYYSEEKQEERQIERRRKERSINNQKDLGL